MTDNGTTSVSDSRNNAKSHINNNNNNDNKQSDVESDAREESAQDQHSRNDTSSHAKSGNHTMEAVATEEASKMDSAESETSPGQEGDSTVNNGDIGAVDTPSANSETSTEVQREEFVEFQINDAQSSPPEGINPEPRSKYYFFYLGLL